MKKEETREWPSSQVLMTTANIIPNFLIVFLNMRLHKRKKKIGRMKKELEFKNREISMISM